MEKSKLAQLLDNNNKFEIFIDKNYTTLQYRFTRSCVQWLSGFEFDDEYPNKDEVKQFTTLNDRGTCGLRQDGRHFFGYQGAGGMKGIDCDIYSLAAIKSGLPRNKLVRDHIMGVTAIGWSIHDILKKKYDTKENKKDIIEYMGDWIIDNLHLWVCVFITKEEHSKLAKDKHTLHDKINFVHYDEAGIEVTLKK